MTTPPIETIKNLDEPKILGYFETIRSVFLMKCAVYLLLEQVRDSEAAKIFHALLSRTAGQLTDHFGDTPTLKALQQANPEVIENLKEDITTTVVLSSWAVFEQIIKDMPNPNYADDPTAYNADFSGRNSGLRKMKKRIWASSITFATP